VIDLGDTEAVLRERDALRVLDAAATEFGHRGHGKPAPEEWREWVSTLFPNYVVHPMGEHHVKFWEHVWNIKPDSAPRSFCAIFPRGGGKTNTAELAVSSCPPRCRAAGLGHGQIADSDPQRTPLDTLRQTIEVLYCDAPSHQVRASFQRSRPRSLKRNVPSDKTLLRVRCPRVYCGSPGCPSRMRA